MEQIQFLSSEPEVISNYSNADIRSVFVVVMGLFIGYYF
jgi:hypothetical protein